MLATLCVAVMSVGLVACGDSSDDSGSSSSSGNDAASKEAAANASKCGLGNGQKATDTPIKLGAIITKQPGTDFTDISDMAKAYFDCVNDNGGINGHPVQYQVETEQTNPQQVASLATKLVENDKVLGIVGNTSLIDCAVNQKYYEKQKINLIANGVARECYFSENIRDINMGPYFSTVGAPVPDQTGCEVHRRRDAQGAGDGLQQPGRRRAREAEQHPRQVGHRGRADQRRCSAGAQAGAGRR